MQWCITLEESNRFIHCTPRSRKFFVNFLAIFQFCPHPSKWNEILPKCIWLALHSTRTFCLTLWLLFLQEIRFCSSRVKYHRIVFIQMMHYESLKINELNQWFRYNEDIVEIYSQFIRMLACIACNWSALFLSQHFMYAKVCVRLQRVRQYSSCGNSTPDGCLNNNNNSKFMVNLFHPKRIINTRKLRFVMLMLNGSKPT